MIEAILITLAIACGVFGYRFAKKTNREMKESTIISEQLLPKPTYLTYVPEKDISTFVPTWEASKERSSQNTSEFDVEIEYEDEPIKRFSTTHYTTAIDSLIAAVHPLQTLSMIDWDVVNALDFSHKDDLSEYSDLKDFISHHMVNLNDGDGWYTRLHGYVAEQEAGRALADAGHSITFPESPNQPGFDLTLDGHLWQVKAGADPQAIVEHLEKYPGIPVFTTPEMASHFPDNPMVSPLSELDHGAIKDSVHDTMNTIDHGDFTGGLHFPIVTGLFSSYREIDLLLSGRTDLGSALVNAGLDIAGTGLGGFAGAKAGALAGSFAGPVGTVIGAIFGGIAGALFGRSISNEMKAEPLKQAMAKYQQTMHDQIDSEIATAQTAFSSFLDGRQRSFWNELEEVDRYFKPLILAEKKQYQSRLQEFIKSFDDILQQIERELSRQRLSILANIKRSNRLRRMFWPSKQDIYYDLIDKWFSSRLHFVNSKRREYAHLNTAIESDQQLKKELENIFAFAKENPFRNQQFELWLSNLETKYNEMLDSIDQLRRKARIVTEIKRQSQTELIKAELFNTYANLTKALKKKLKKVKPLYNDVVKEANRLGIEVKPS